jgi:putative acetyltransferase
MSASVQVRHERPGDEDAIARVHDRAFGQLTESRIVAAVRRAGRAVISLVAVDPSGIVGHILFTPLAVDSPGPPISALALGPMAVLPDVQRRGVGSRLVAAGLEACALTGCQAVAVIGHPSYYPRFGFRPGASYGLRSEFAVPDDVFMIAELTADALTGREGIVRYTPEFQME